MSKKSLLEQKKEQYEGKVYPTKTSGDLVVVEYISSDKVLVRFTNTGNERFARMGDINKREVRDKEAFPVYSFGIMDIPNELKKHEPKPKEYNTWNNMLNRCYNENMRHSHTTYVECTVSDEFRRYSFFKEWCNNQIGFGIDKWHLDKDILSKGNKIYSPETCCFVPNEINCALPSSKKVRGGLPQGVIWNCTKTRYRARIQRKDKWESLGSYATPEEAFYVYKPAKERHIRSLAEKYKDQIDSRVYNALMNWTIKITD